jgi:hypothetical protein
MANQAISVADITLNLLKKVEIKASSGNSAAQEAWTFIRKAKSSERVLYLLAISQAINSAAGGGFKKEDVINTLDKIPNHYLEDFPPEHNKNLSFILSK